MSGLDLRRLLRRRLAARIVALSLGLLLVVQLLGFETIRRTIDSTARQQLAQELERGAIVWTDLLGHQAEQIGLAGRMAAKDFGFQQTLFGEAVDGETVASGLESLAGRVGAELSVFVGIDRQVRGLSAGDVDGMALARLARDMAQGSGRRQVQVLDGRPYHLVATEILAPVRRGWLVFGFPIDRDMVARLRALAGMEVALVAGEPGARRVVLSSLDLADGASMHAAAHVDELQLAGETMLVRRVPLGEVEAVLMRSIPRAVAPYARLQAWLALITAAGLALFAVASVGAARFVTTPLSALAAVSRRLGQGHYDEPVSGQAREDEIGQLAKSLDLMRVGIAEREASVHRLAYFDKLTGLPNRANFAARVQAMVDGGRHDCLSVLVLNLNRFKPVNDALGYELGDQLLCQVADRLTASLRKADDMVARLGGDEFALMLPGSSCEQAAAAARRIAAAFEVPLRLGDQMVDLSAAFGVACWPSQAERADQLLSRAEIAMHAAKRRTELVMVYETAMDPDSATTLSLLSELRRAVDRQELRLFLQPKFALATGRMVGAEALVRWLHPVRGMVPPMAFIPFAEQTGFVRELTTWIFDDAARQWPALAAAGLDRVSVNLSARDVMDLGLPERLDGILARRGVPAEAFCLEITESAIMDDPQRALNILQALKARGFKLSIDDFGEGYTSLKHLRHLPVDELKVDGIFVKKMDEVPQDENVVRSVVGLAQNLGLSVVAEGVENAEVWRRLAAMGCDEAQGFHMCRPLPADELPAFGRRWAAEHGLPVPAEMAEA